MVQQLAGSQQIRAEAAGTGLAAEIDDVIAAILVSRFNGRTVPEICAMGGITVEDFTSSVAYREIFGLGRQEGRQEGLLEGQQKGRQTEAVALTLHLLEHRCGGLDPQPTVPHPESPPECARAPLCCPARLPGS